MAGFGVKGFCGLGAINPLAFLTVALAFRSVIWHYQPVHVHRVALEDFWVFAFPASCCGED